MFIIFIIMPFSSLRAYLSFTFSCHQTFVLITLKLLFLVSALPSLIRSGVFRSLFSMAEGGCEKFPDHWNAEFFWTVIVECISHGHPVDILIKRWVMIILLFLFLFVFFFLNFYDLIFNISISLFQDFSILRVQKIGFGI